ncbi:MAG: inorganic phosphate transporter [Hyphomicrobiales bacterium]|nr:inorganic phosphate transporter [Hyphomicrobiales bacterium]MCP5371803.1 inorganic phosphate transporter [Hyphomicrobiales bacterium]
MGVTYWLAVATIAVVLIFDYTNGFHDAANIVAQPIASRAMTPIQAVLVVGTFEFLGPLLGGTAVANTIGKFIVMDDIQATLSMTIILCGCLGAITWNLATWWYGIPSSSSHALVGGLVGPVVVSVGPEYVVWGFDQMLTTGKMTGVAKVIVALILSPIVGFWAGYIVHRLMGFALRGAKPVVNKYLRLGQYVSSAGLAFSHGTNDAQKSMGIITMVLVMGGMIPEFKVPLWVILSCAAAITLGILSGGWRIVRTIGFGIYKIRPLHAINGQVTSASVILTASLLGGPVSTTHVTSSGLMGIGASERARAVHWSKAREILTTWVLTIPGAAVAGIVFYLVFKLGDLVFG